MAFSRFSLVGIALPHQEGILGPRPSLLSLHSCLWAAFLSEGEFREFFLPGLVLARQSPREGTDSDQPEHWMDKRHSVYISFGHSLSSLIPILLNPPNAYSSLVAKLYSTSKSLRSQIEGIKGAVVTAQLLERYFHRYLINTNT